MSAKAFALNVTYIIGAVLISIATSMLNAPAEHTFSVPAFILSLGISSIIYSIGLVLSYIGD
jgi:ribose/xylose/arabinose/galactoside ABC-type transport system permease subunit